MTAREPRPQMPPGGGCPYCQNQGALDLTEIVDAQGSLRDVPDTAVIQIICPWCCGAGGGFPPPQDKPPSLREALENIERLDRERTLEQPTWILRVVGDIARAALAAPVDSPSLRELATDLSRWWEEVGESLYGDDEGLAGLAADADAALAAAPEHEEGGCGDDGCLCWRAGRESESRPVWSAP